MLYVWLSIYGLNFLNAELNKDEWLWNHIPFCWTAVMNYIKSTPLWLAASSVRSNRHCQRFIHDKINIVTVLQMFDRPR